YIAKFRGQIRQFCNYVLKNKDFDALPDEIRDKLSSTIHALEKRVPFDLPYSGYLNDHPRPTTDIRTTNAMNDVLDIYIPHQLHYTLPGRAIARLVVLYRLMLDFPLDGVPRPPLAPTKDAQGSSQTDRW
ncbi:hypothetical protein FOL47_011225, partial [Perkinsus chesapeaki]